MIGMVQLFISDKAVALHGVDLIGHIRCWTTHGHFKFENRAKGCAASRIRPSYVFWLQPIAGICC